MLRRFASSSVSFVNTVDSSNLTTPIIGLVAEDLCWNGKVILRADSEVHGIASVDRVRERIASEGEFTFVLNEPDRRGRELVIKGLVLDMERDPEYDTYGITDGSAGLRGDVIRTANNDVIKLYAASLISGMSGAVSSGSSGILGNRVYTNNSFTRSKCAAGRSHQPGRRRNSRCTRPIFRPNFEIDRTGWLFCASPGRKAILCVLQ